MDERQAREILDRLARVETKLDTVITFTTTLERVFGAWLSGGRGKLLTALARAKGGAG